MNTVFERVINAAESLAGPFNWRATPHRNQTVFTGCFLVFDRYGSVQFRVRGRIVCRRRSASDVYLYDPPGFVTRHQHGRCLQLLRPNDKWFKLHFEKPATDFRAAYSYVEHFLTEAYRLTH